MLPTGHIGAGYLTGYALLKFSGTNFTPSQINHLLAWATFFGFAPDLDVLWYFFKNRTVLVAGEAKKSNHRFYLSHAPVLWLIAGLLVFFLASDPYIKFIGLLLWLGSWSHFILDSVEYGIMWLWPLNNKIYALKDTAQEFSLSEKNFFNHSWSFLKFYSTRLSFYLELIIIITALIVFFH